MIVERIVNSEKNKRLFGDSVGDTEIIMDEEYVLTFIDDFAGTELSKDMWEYCPELYDGNFHTYAVRWSPTEYKWYIDGELVWKSKAGGVCDNPGYMKLTLEVGSWAGEIVMEELPATVEVEYVRAYQFAGM